MRLRSGSRDRNSNSDQKDAPESQEVFEGTIVDKLTLIKSYETTLRNQGLNPLEDARIYELLFRVVQESEAYL